jgi:superfamily I DNA/RNA helicase
MELFEKCFSELAEMEIFDPRAFSPDENVSKEVCGFILSLALIYTDIKNLTMFYQATLESRPKGEFKLQKNWGEYIGLSRFLDRLNISALHELFKLIEREKDLLDDSFMKSLIRTLNKEARSAWKALVDASLLKVSSDKCSKELMFIRNKITFHYDRKIVLSGFEHFIKYGTVTRDPYISRGNNMAKSRFYFADAAAEHYLLSLGGIDNLEKLFEQVREMIKKINLCIYLIVINFIQKRGVAYRRA